VTAVFEAIGVLCPAILFAVAEGTLGASGRVQTRHVVHDAVGPVVDFLDDCTEPSDDGRALAIGELYVAYTSEEKGTTAISVQNFAAELDRERGRPEMRTRVRKFGDRYYGIGLVSGKAVPAARLKSSGR
jgi:hypothetical protein